MCCTWYMVRMIHGEHVYSHTVMAETAGILRLKDRCNRMMTCHLYMNWYSLQPACVGCDLYADAACTVTLKQKFCSGTNSSGCGGCKPPRHCEQSDVMEQAHPEEWSCGATASGMSLHAALCSSPIAHHLWSWPIAHHPLPITYWPWPIAHRPLLITYWPWLIAHHPLPITYWPWPYCPSPIAHHLLAITYCPSPIAHPWPIALHPLPIALSCICLMSSNTGIVHFPSTYTYSPSLVT